jgi:poly(glycerol-phosphate) alpha-glucosyltransferase
MKIALLTAYVTRNAGGLLPAIMDLFHSYMKKYKQDDISLFSNIDAYTNIDLKQWYPIKVSVFSNQFGKFLFSPTLKKAIFNNDHDILHLHGLWQYPQLLAYKWKNKNPERKLIVTTHGMLDMNLLKMRSTLKRMIGMTLFPKKVFNNVDCYHALNLAELDALRKYGIKSPIAVIPNGVTIPENNTGITPTDGKKHLLYLGRIHPKKGLDLLLKAIYELMIEDKELLNDWILDIVGWGQVGFDERMKKLTFSLGLSDYVHFHDALFGDEKVKMYRMCNGYILPSLSEGLPMTVLEAWSYKKSVIMTEECNLFEGFEFNAAIKIHANVASIKNGLRLFFKLKEKERIQLGINGYNLVLRKFTWDRVSENMRKVYLWLLNEEERPDFIHEIV